MAGIIFTRYESSPSDGIAADARETSRWSRRALLSSAVGLGAAAAFTGRAAAQRGPLHAEATPQQDTPASPVADVGDDADHGVASMLAAIPLSSVQAAVSDGQWCRYTSLRTQWDALGVTPPMSMSLDTLDIPVGTAMLGMVIDSSAFQYAAQPEFVEALGFQPLTVHEVLSIGEPPDVLQVFHGGIDLDALPSAWEAVGFDRVSSHAGDDIWTLGAEGEVDFENPFSRATVGGMNNVTILENGHVVFTRQQQRLETLLKALAEGEASLAEQQALAALVPTLPAEVMSMIAMDGSTLSRVDPARALLDDQLEAMEERFAESDDAVGPMPLLGMILIGVTGAPFGSDGDPDRSTLEEVPEDAGHLLARLETISPEQAAQAAEVVAYRWEQWTTKQGDGPYTEFGTVDRAEADGNVAVLDFAAGLRTVNWTSLVFGNDLAVFAS